MMMRGRMTLAAAGRGQAPRLIGRGVALAAWRTANGTEPATEALPALLLAQGG